MKRKLSISLCIAICLLCIPVFAVQVEAMTVSPDSSMFITQDMMELSIETTADAGFARVPVSYVAHPVENNVPAPDTGDYNNILQYMGIAAIAIILLGTVLIVRRFNK